MRWRAFLITFFFILLSFCKAQNCMLDGECQGTIGQLQGPSSSYNDCLQSCQEDSICRWFTFFGSPKFECVHYYEPCLLPLSTNCASCISGERDCDKGPLTCSQHGACIGSFEAADVFPTELECIDACKLNSRCTWYTYYNISGDCQLTRSCVGIDQTCSYCIFGEKDCGDDPLPTGPSLNKLMIVGSYGVNNYRAEIVDLKNASTTCPTVSDFPIHYGSAGAYVDDMVLVCGGGYSTSDPLDNCYSYNRASNSWDSASRMISERIDHVGTILSNGDWWIAGGYSYNGARELSTEVFSNGQFTYYANLPATSTATHLVLINIDEDRAVLIDRDTHAYIFSRDTETWESLPNMPYSFIEMGGGRIIRDDGSIEIIITGGDNNLNLFVYKLDQGLQGIWEPGPPLPVPIGFRELMGPGSIEYGDTFLIVGGYSGSSRSDIIMKYDLDEDTFVLLDQRLYFDRQYPAVILLPDDYVECI